MKVLPDGGEEEEVDDADEGAYVGELDDGDKTGTREDVWRWRIRGPGSLTVMSALRVG